MIVVDTNLIVYLLLPGERTEQAEQIFEEDGEWFAPLLWRSEFRNVMASYVRRGTIPLDRALEIMEQAELLMERREFMVSSGQVLHLASASRCSSYDCEFVVLARDLDVPLVTSDEQILAAFPKTAVSPERFET